MYASCFSAPPRVRQPARNATRSDSGGSRIAGRARRAGSAPHGAAVEEHSSASGEQPQPRIPKLGGNPSDCEGGRDRQTEPQQSGGSAAPAAHGEREDVGAEQQDS